MRCGPRGPIFKVSKLGTGATYWDVSHKLQVETQRLASQKEYFEKNIAEMEAELQDLIETADTTEKDAK